MYDTTAIYPLSVYRPNLRAPQGATHISDCNIYYKKGSHGKWCYYAGDDWRICAKAPKEKRYLGRHKNKEITPTSKDQLDWRDPNDNSILNSHHRVARYIIDICGQELKNIRTALNISIKQAAKTLNVSEDSIYRAEQFEQNSAAYSSVYPIYRDFLLSLAK